uniref:DOMON domain-containing protein n=1 Tax=Chlamydomonas leiostraca TaxID=1034604 RepID=A0A7S0X0H6_9CHLO
MKLPMGPRAQVALVVAVGLLAFAASQESAICFSEFSRSVYPYCKELTSEVALHWKIEWGQIQFGIAMAGKYRFVGLGLSDSGGMLGTDMAVLVKEESVTAGSAWTIGDYWSTNFTTPVRDTQQDWTLLGFAQTSMVTTLEISRPLDTCDPYGQDNMVYNDTDTTIVWAYGDKFEYHGPRRGSATLRLNPANYNTTLNVSGLAGANSTVSWFNQNNVTGYTYRQALLAQDPPDLEGEPVTINSLTVKPGQTQYLCTNQELSLDESSKYHVIRYGAYNVNPAIVHHMVLYACTSNPPTGKGYTCNTMPKECSTPIAFWAPGMPTNFTLPPEAGIAFGGDIPHYVALQIHYNNVAARTVDNSGFMLYYTKTLRPSDMGVLTLGTTALTLPPGKASVSSVPSSCPASCTSRLPANLTMTYAWYHMHGAGSTISVRHVRGANETQPLGGKRYWSLAYQGMSQILPESRTLVPGDSLLTTCTYNTTGRQGTTSWGYGAQDETCYAFVYYYPAVPTWTECIQDPRVPVASCRLPATQPTSDISATNVSRLVMARAVASAALAAVAKSPATPAVTATTANLTALRNSINSVLASGNITDYLSLLDKDYTGLLAALSNLNETLIAQQALLDVAAGSDPTQNLRVKLEQAVTAALTASTAVSGSGGTMMWQAVPFSGKESFTTYFDDFALPAIQALPVAVVTPNDTTMFAPYEAPCTRQAPPKPPYYNTGPAIGAIVSVILVLGFIGAILWMQFARKEDPERQQLLAALEETIVHAVEESPDIDEETLKRRLEEVARQKVAETDANKSMGGASSLERADSDFGKFQQAAENEAGSK